MRLESELSVQVTAITQVAAEIRRYRFEAVDGQPLPVFSGGSHVVVTLQDGAVLRRNPYSLMSDPADTRAYEISVLRVPQSRGGSLFLHDNVKVGDGLTISQPVNLFPLAQRAKKHLFIAGGIGITPFIAMMAQLQAEGANFQLHYGMRSSSHGAYAQELLQRYGAQRVHRYYDDQSSYIAVASLLAHQPLGTHLYVCGPAGMIDAVLGQARQAGWPQENLHSERFIAPPTGDAFRVALQRSGRQIEVAGNQSILEALEAAGMQPPCLCRGGACGHCETAVVECEGQLQHHDHWLSEEERAAGKKIMICVSRFSGQSLLLDM